MSDGLYEEPRRRASDVAAFFDRVGQTTSKRALRAVRRLADVVKEQAVKNAPILHGDLEHAIETREEQGVNRRITAIVEVTDQGLNRSDVLDYAGVIERGEFEKLGERSLAKGPEVGPHFLERAFDKYEDEIPDDLIDEILGDLL